MTTYSTLDDLKAAYTDSVVNQWLSPPGASTPDEEVYNSIAAKCFSRINSYLGVRYQLPINSPLGDLTDCEVAFIAYRLSFRPFFAANAKVKDEYEFQKTWLEDIRDGKAQLDYATPNNQTTNAQTSPAFYQDDQFFTKEGLDQF